MPRQRRPVYQLEGVPPDLWRRAKARAALEGQSIRGVFLAFLQEYAAGAQTQKPEHIAQLSADARRESRAEAPDHRVRRISSADARLIGARRRPRLLGDLMTLPGSP